MYNLMGTKENLRNICLLAKPFFQSEVTSLASIKAAYLRFLQVHQPTCPIPAAGSALFVDNPEAEDQLAELFKTEGKLDDRQQSKLLRGGYTPEEVESRIVVTQRSLDSMRDQLPQTYELFDLAIHSLFFRKAEGAGGGSTSNAVGVIWSNIRTQWSNQDILEVLLHEMTHNLVFLDELCHLHYTDYDEVTKTENYALSAILKIRRPLDKVVHSIIVATEILAFRSRSLGHPTDPKAHPPTPLLWEQTLNSVRSVLNDEKVSRLLTPRSRLLLTKCQDLLESEGLQEAV